jgi:hypothetical protein
LVTPPVQRNQNFRRTGTRINADVAGAFFLAGEEFGSGYIVQRNVKDRLNLRHEAPKMRSTMIYCFRP